jgi:transcriptional regulator with XRE-family HTH domain
MKKEIRENRIRIGREIAELRTKNGMSQRKLAELTGFNNSNIARIELGRYSVGLDILAKIAEALGREVELIEKPTE